MPSVRGLLPKVCQGRLPDALDLRGVDFRLHPTELLHLHDYRGDRMKVHMLIHDVESDSWGTFVYRGSSQRPGDEAVWYDLLTQDDEKINDLLHFWVQFCLDYKVLTEDLQKLSNATEEGYLKRTDRDRAPLTIFAEEYPILF